MTRTTLRILARLLAPWRTIRRLERTNKRLEEVLADPTLAGIEIGRETAFTAGMQGSGPQLLAGMFMGLMEKWGDKAPNCLELIFESPQGQILVSVTRPGKATPLQLKEQAEQRVRQLKTELQQLQGDLEEHF